jgi:hypothetical protein
MQPVTILPTMQSCLILPRIERGGLGVVLKGQNLPSTAGFKFPGDRGAIRADLEAGSDAV